MSLMETIQLLGNVGEFVGAIAVVVTLVYLAVQVRHGSEATEINTNQLKGEAIREINNTEQELVHKIRDDPEMFSIFMRSLLDWDSVSAKEQARAHLLLYSYSRWLETCWNLSALKALDQNIYKSRELFMLGILNNPKGARIWWEMWKELYDPDFVADFDRALEAYDPGESYVLKAPFYAPEHWMVEGPPSKAVEPDT
jgi:hypothetical protein